MLRPWITIGLVEEDIVGLKLGSGLSVGTGAKLLGPVRVGSTVRIGFNAVALCIGADGASAVGVPARVLDGSVTRGARPPTGEEGRAAAARLQTKEGSM